MFDEDFIFDNSNETTQYDFHKDQKVLAATEALKKHFLNSRNDPIKTPYYQTQLTVLYETDYFPWVIKNALTILEEENFIKRIKHTKTIKRKEHTNKPKQQQKPEELTYIFYVHKQVYSTDPSGIQKKIDKITNIATKFIHPDITYKLGKHLEDLVKNELRAQQFEIKGRNTNEYNGRKWETTNHDLDIIASHKKSNFTVGVEVKNRLSLMDKKEVDTKIQICKHLKITPLFAVRWIKPYMYEIKNQGGYSWMFKSQIYPVGYDSLVKNIYQKLSVLNKKNSKKQILQFPVITRSDLPEKSINIITKWVEENTK